MNDVVTNVAEEKRGALVTINGEETLWISRAIWRECDLSEGKELDLDELKQWLLPRQYPIALDYAVSLLAARDHSRHELEKKLSTRRYLDDTIEMVLYKLEKERLLDDERFAHQWAAARARQRLGKHRILQELRMKGVDREIAENAVNELDEEENDDHAYELALKLVKKHQDEEPYKAMNKVLAAMARRGFGFDEAKAAASRAIETLREEEEEEE